jgi:hypothetical protein
MSATRFGRLHRATALVPMALLSAAWTASIVGANAPLAAAGQRPDPTLPDGTSVPTQAIEAPASVSDGSVLGPGVDGADAAQIISSSSTSGIPSAALDGANRTSEIVDTDAGQYDNDTQYDRAIGPMQFIPSTWSVVGVDADGDGVRNPQDIDDAALGTAVYLCSGSDDLGTDGGRQAAVYRYNHSQSYVDLVLAIMDAYLQGDFTSIPNAPGRRRDHDAGPRRQLRRRAGDRRWRGRRRRRHDIQRWRRHRWRWRRW